MKRIVIALAAAVMVLAYLRDPAWLIDKSSGLSGWDADSTGHAFRWTTGHASFFVPAGTGAVRLPLSTRGTDHGRRPVTVRIAVNDRNANVLTLTNDEWTTCDLLLAGVPRDRRRVIRIDLFVDRVTGDGDQGVRLGEIARR